MNADQDRTFRPRLESLEDRFLLTGLSMFGFRLPPFLARRVALPARPPATSFAGGTHTPAEVHTIVNPVHAVTRSVSIVPQHISLGLFDKPSPVTLGGVDTGLSEFGLPGSATSTGFTTAGLPHFAPSQPLTAPPLQTAGFTISPQGIVSGSLF